MAECTELMERESQRLQEVASAGTEDDAMNLAEQMQEMVLPSVRSVAENLNPDSSHPMQILLGEGNTAISGCSFNITNFYGSDNGVLQKSSVTEVESPCPLPPRPEEPNHHTTGGPSPSPKWAKSNEEMLLRVVPLATEMEDCNDDLILVVWFCWDDDQTFQKIVHSEHDSGNVTLDSYDTIVLKKPDSNWCTIPVSLTANEAYSWMPRKREKKIQSIQVWNADRGKCSFRIQKNEEHPESELIYLTLQIKQYYGGPGSTQFIIKKKIADIKMPEEDKTKLLKLLDTKVSVPRLDDSNFVQSDDGGCSFRKDCLETPLTCWAIPYIDRLFSIDDDVIVTLWLCGYDKKGKLLEGLKGEQRLYGRELLDTENSFILTNSEEEIETVLIHNGYRSFWESGESRAMIDVHRIMQGMRAKFQFISRRVEGSVDYAERIDPKIGEGDPSGMEKNLLSEKNRNLPHAFNLLPNVKPNKLDVEICTWQGEQVPIEFRKVTEVTRFVRGEKNKTHKSHLSSRLKSRITNAVRYLKEKREDFKNVIFQAHCSYESDDWEVPVLESQSLPVAQSGYYYGDNKRRDTFSGVHISNLYYGQRRGYADIPSSAYIPDPQQHVLRLFIYASQDSDYENALAIHVVMGTLDFTSSHNLVQNEVHGWAAVDSYDTFLLTSQVCGCYNPLVKVTFEAQHTSRWLPESDKMVLDVKEILKAGRVECSCRFVAISDSQSDYFYGTVKISQTVGKSKEEVDFVIKKKVEDIQLILEKEANSSIPENIISPVQKPDDANEGVMLDEYQTFLAVSYVDLIQNINDDIILSVWICSIQQSKNDFNILCKDQKKFMKKQLDTENSFILYDMTSPVYAKVECHALGIVEEPLKKVDPRRIKEGGRAKFQFICKRQTNEKSDKFDVEITIRQNHWNQAQFMTRKKIDFFLQEGLPTNIQDTETETK